MDSGKTNDKSQTQILIRIAALGLVFIAAVSAIIILAVIFGKGNEARASEDAGPEVQREAVTEAREDEETEAESVTVQDAAEASESSVEAAAEKSTEAETDTAEESSETAETFYSAEDYPVEIVLPSEYAGAVSDEDLAAMAAAEGVGAVVRQDDGSIFYAVTEEKRLDLADAFEEDARERMRKVAFSEDCPNVTDVQADENLAVFAVTTRNTEPSDNEIQLYERFSAESRLIHTFRGDEAPETTLLIFNLDTRKVIYMCGADLDE